MPDFLITWAVRLLFTTVLFVILLSFTGRSTGIRVYCAQLLFQIFEWVHILQGEEEVEEEFDSNNVRDEIENTGSGGTEYEEERAGEMQRLKLRRPASSNSLIIRQWSEVMDRKLHSDVETDDEYEKPVRPDDTLTVIVNDSLEFVSAGIEAIIEDEVTSRFSAAQLASWNLLSRNRTFMHINWKLTLLWFLGFILRYAILLPVRFVLFTFGLILLFSFSILAGFLPDNHLKKTINERFMLTFMRTMSTAFSSIITFHDIENRPRNGICVANHTSPIDVMILSCDNCYAMIGQRHGGILGYCQMAVSRCAHHIWFERSESSDRNAVRRALKDHVKDPDKLPILIFPEGTCINNTSVMMFKKGSFEIADVVYPIAVKYDNRLGDAFWNSSKQGYFSYLMSMMTSWALIADVWYLPPVHREESEDAADFARRVKRLIAKKGGLVDLEWDGNLKRSKVPDRLKNAQKELFFQYLSRNTRFCENPVCTESVENNEGRDLCDDCIRF